MTAYVVFPHAMRGLSVFKAEDIGRGRTVTQEIRERGGRGDKFEMLEYATVAEALEAGSAYLKAAPGSPISGRVLGLAPAPTGRAGLHLVTAQFASARREAAGPHHA